MKPSKEVLIDFYSDKKEDTLDLILLILFKRFPYSIWDINNDYFLKVFKEMARKMGEDI